MRKAVATAPEPAPAPAPDVESPTSSQATAATSEPPSSQPQSEMPPSDPDFEVFLSVPATLHLFDHDLNQYDPMGAVTAQIGRSRSGSPFDHRLSIVRDGQKMLVHNIDSGMNPRWVKSMSSFTWNYESNGHQSSWAIALNDPEDYEPFKQFFTRANWERLNQEPWAKAKVSIVYHSLRGHMLTYFQPDEQAYVMNSNYDEDVVMRDVEDDSDEESEVADELGARSDHGVMNVN